MIYLDALLALHDLVEPLVVVVFFRVVVMFEGWPDFFKGLKRDTDFGVQFDYEELEVQHLVDHFLVVWFVLVLSYWGYNYLLDLLVLENVA